MHLQAIGVLDEPTLTVSPWFEARRTDYYGHFLAVSTRGDWDPFIRFCAAGLQASAAVAEPSSTVRQVEARPGVSYGRSNALTSQLMELGVLDAVDEKAYKRLFFAPRVIDVLAGESGR